MKRGRAAQSLPIGRQMRDRLVLPMYLALETLSTDPDPAALAQAWHDLLLPVEMMRIACHDRPDVARVLSVASRALSDIWDRRDRSWRPTGTQREALKLATTVCDDVIPYLRTGQIRRALEDVTRRLRLI